ncbi:MAG: hypothetical protein MI746_05140, partial [Pseudomonadales bacterium]|nr:hypothetical protein [Pseudomonadales bacterium]
SATDSLGQELQLNNNALMAVARPGIYTASIDDVPSRYAVNVLPEEADFTRVAAATVYDAVINPDTSPIQSREVRTAQLIEELERPQRMWWYILALVMLLLLAEALIANRTYR